MDIEEIGEDKIKRFVQKDDKREGDNKGNKSKPNILQKGRGVAPFPNLPGNIARDEIEIDDYRC